MSRIGEWKDQFSRYVRADHQDYMKAIEVDKRWDDEMDAWTEDIISIFNKQFGVEGFESYEPKRKPVAAEPVAAGAGAGNKTANDAKPRAARKK